MQRQFFPWGKSDGRLSRAKKFTDFKINRRSTQRRVILRENVEINAFEQLKKEAERDYLENKIDAMDDDYLISTIWSQETKAQSLVLSQKMDKSKEN